MRNNGGGFWNHDFFWKIMGPAGSTQPSGALAAAIETYGGLDKLKEDFNTKGAGQFGSGWAWVIKDSSGALKVVSTPNQAASNRLPASSQFTTFHHAFR